MYSRWTKKWDNHVHFRKLASSASYNHVAPRCYVVVHGSVQGANLKSKFAPTTGDNTHMQHVCLEHHHVGYSALF